MLFRAIRQSFTRFSTLRRLALGASMAAGVAALGTDYLQPKIVAFSDSLMSRVDEQQIQVSNAKINVNQAIKELQLIFGDRMDLDDTTHGPSPNAYHHSELPSAVVYPNNTEEVAAAMKICYSHNVPVLPYGSGTSLEGQTVVPGEWPACVCIDLSKMDRIIAIHEDDFDAVVQAGVTWQNLNASLKPHGLFLPVDPGPGASIGGMVGTGCSGTLCVRYGAMQRHVLNVTMVRPDGRIVKTGQRAQKSSAGYHLAQLMVGSEGTLGIVTEVTLRLAPIPEAAAVIMSPFKTLSDATKATLALRKAGVQLTCVELLDDVMMKAIKKYAGIGQPDKPALFIKLSGHKEAIQADLLRATKVMAAHGACIEDMQYASEDKEVDHIWQARKGALWAAMTLRADNPNVRSWTTDVAVPLSRLAECIEATQEDLKSSFLIAPIVGHVGDGNFHVCILVDSENPKELMEAKRINEVLVSRALSMEGTCTGEHGVGIGKKKYLRAEVGDEAIQLMRDIKTALDPKWLLNQGKVFDKVFSDFEIDNQHHHHSSKSSDRGNGCGCL